MYQRFYSLLSLSLSLILLLLGCSDPTANRSGALEPGSPTLATTENVVSSHYIIFFYKDADGADYRFVVLPEATAAPADYAAIGAYDGSISLKAKPVERAGMIFLPGAPTLDGTSSSNVRVPTATLSASTTYKLYAAKEDGEVISVTVQTGARGAESPFRVRRNGELLERIYVGKKYGIVPYSDFSPATERTSPVSIWHTPSGGSRSYILANTGMQDKYVPVVNLHDMGGTGAGAGYAEGVLLFRDSDHTSLDNDAKNLGRNSTIEVRSNNGYGTATIHLHFSDDAENQRSITNESGFATSPAVD